MKEDNLFVLFVCCIEIFSNHVFYHTFDIIGRLSMSKDALSWFHNVLICNGEVIEYWKNIAQSSFESKLKTIGKFGCTFGILRKP
jgi:hypothetical protein